MKRRPYANWPSPEKASSKSFARVTENLKTEDTLAPTCGFDGSMLLFETH
jgi:hypothetical protein